MVLVLRWHDCPYWKSERTDKNETKQNNHRIPGLISNYIKFSGHKVNIEKLIALLYVSNKQMEFEIKITNTIYIGIPQN